MAFKITDACIDCGACAGVCPVDACVEAEGTEASFKPTEKLPWKFIWHR